ncbi:hypothetical protein KIPB_001380 [Kipferlia bialata]|uniref:Outer dynein arm-docking complex subunit 4 n=1 Tax=Kipferlia bialata TaxID=797122 RepID=A0A9K3CQQ3_9EUKA|nr:hypothetical protein KIPB_001380 [Kipferlia bialata]|eukprot:g1380.t1
MDHFRLYVAEGDACYRTGEFGRAVDAYTKALDLRRDDKNVLMARSKCYVALAKPDLAIKDADTCIGSDRSFYRGIYQKAEALFTSGDFELALVFYHRAHRLRTDVEIYKLGIQKAQDAIYSAFRTQLPEGYYHDPLEEEENESDTDSEEERVCTTPPIMEIMPAHTPAGQASLPAVLMEAPEDSASLSMSLPASRLDRKKGKEKKKKRETLPPLVTKVTPTKRLLGSLYADHAFLAELAKDTNLMGDAEIKGLVGESLDYLDARSEFWRQQVPPKTNLQPKVQSVKPPPKVPSAYAPRRRINTPSELAQCKREDAPRERSAPSGTTYPASHTVAPLTAPVQGQRERGARDHPERVRSTQAGARSRAAVERERKNTALMRFVTESMNNVTEAVNSGAPSLALRFVKQVHRRLSQPDPVAQGLPDRSRIMGDVETAFGCALYDLERFSSAIQHHKAVVDVCELGGDGLGVVRGLRNLGRTYQRMGDPRNAAPCFLKVLELGLDDAELEGLGLTVPEPEQRQRVDVCPFILADAALQVGRSYFDAQKWTRAALFGTRSLELFRGLLPPPDSAEVRECHNDPLLAEIESDVLDVLLRDVTLGGGYDPDFEDFVHAAPSFYSYAEPTSREVFLDALCLTGRSQFLSGNVSQARLTLLECLELSKVWQDHTAEAAALTNLSVVLAKLGQIEASKSYRFAALHASTYIGSDKQ